MELDGEDIYLLGNKPSQHRYPTWDLSLTLSVERVEEIGLHVFYNSKDPEYNACPDRHCGLPVTTAQFRKLVSDVEFVWQTHVRGENSISDVVAAGQQLFNDIFGAGHVNTPALDTLKKFLRTTSDPLRIEIIAPQSLQFPWQLLYIDNASADSGAPLEGFLGAKHNVVQHIQVAMMESRRHQLQKFGTREKLHLSLQRDTEDARLHDSLDAISNPLARAGYLHLSKRDSGKLLIQDLNQGKCSEDLMYFCCHGWTGTGGGSHITLSGKKIFPTEFEAALGGNALRCQPAVFINSCYAGNPGAAPFESFVPVLLSGGASTVIGPVVIVDIATALRFAESFMNELFLAITSGSQNKRSFQMCSTESRGSS